MLKNHLRTALRRLMRSKFYTVTNVLGLSISLALCTLVALYVNDEYNYDKFHENGDAIFKVFRTDLLVDDAVEGNGFLGVFENSDMRQIRLHPVPLGTLVKESVAGIKRSTRSVLSQFSIVQEGKTVDLMANHVDSDFLEMFSFKFIHGNPKEALSRPESLVISKAKALELFGRLDAVGETIPLSDPQSGALEVTGVIDVPMRSSIQVDFLRPFEQCDNCVRSQSNWRGSFSEVYLQIESGADVSDIESKIDLVTGEFLNEQKEAFRLRRQLSESSDVFRYELLNIESINLANTSKRLYVVILTGLVLLVFLITITNYSAISLSTAASRVTEISIRRVVGARGMQLFQQLLVESLLLIAVSIVLSFTLLQWLLPQFNSLTQKELQLIELLEPNVVFSVFTMVTTLTVLSVSCLALILLKNKAIDLKRSLYKTNPKLVKGITLFQFVICTFMVSVAFVMSEQFTYISEKELGFDKESLIIIDKIDGYADVLKDELLKLPNISGVSLAGGAIQGNGIYMNRVGQQTAILSYVDEDFIDVMKLELVEQRMADDLALNKIVLLSEELSNAVKADSAKIPESVDGVSIAGVFKDFHFGPLTDPIFPSMLEVNRGTSERYGNAYVRYNSTEGASVLQILTSIEEVWDKISPNRALEYRFMDDELSAQYKKQQIQSKTINSVAVVSILLASIGLIGLVSIKVNNRMKEVSIRKALGASIKDIFQLLSKEYMLTMILANVLALPASYWVAQEWLGTFEYHTNLSLWMFLIPLFVIISIGFFSTLSILIKASRSNPVDVLRY